MRRREAPDCEGLDCVLPDGVASFSRDRSEQENDGRTTEVTAITLYLIPLSPAFCYNWEVVQLAVHQILDLIILVRAQASQPTL